MGIACLTALMAVITTVWHDWIEVVFGVDPDRGSGSLEWLIVVALAVASFSFAALARAELRARA
jgi:hypothetical protein